MQRGSGTGGFIDHIGTIHHLRCLSIRIMLYNYFSSDRSLAPWPLYSIGLMVSWSPGPLVPWSVFIGICSLGFFRPLVHPSNRAIMEPVNERRNDGCSIVCR
jgi:hypothetical protein